MIKSSELVLNPDGSPYHIAVSKQNLATRIILVGDPKRVQMISSHFELVEFQHNKREFYTATGYYRGKRISVISTGIGLDNIDIAINEIDAAFNIDPHTREINPAPISLRFLRLGTCGGIQSEDAVGTFMLSSYALDEAGFHRFYSFNSSADEMALETQFQSFLQQNHLPALPSIQAVSGDTWTEYIRSTHALQSGITLSAIGFYGPQGRSLGRIPIIYPDFPVILKKFQWNNRRFRNIEMETSAIFQLSRALGHESASISVILANRNRGEFASNPQNLVEDLIVKGLDIISEK